MHHQTNILGLLPNGLREPLLDEYQSIVQCFSEGRWLPSELSGGRFCEIVFTVIEGYAIGNYASVPSKPNDFVGACRRLEQYSRVPRSFQILIPRLLPAIFEVRNNRGVGHTGGDVDSNYMDAVFVVTSCSWVMGELVRVFHKVSIEEAQSLVDSLAQRRVPLIWEGNGIRRVLQPSMNLQSQILVLRINPQDRPDIPTRCHLMHHQMLCSARYTPPAQTTSCFKRQRKGSRRDLAEVVSTWLAESYQSRYRHPVDSA